MCIDTNAPKNWNPFPVLALLVAWLVVLATLSFIATSCNGNAPKPPIHGSITLTWSITDLNHQPVTCAQVSARSVALRLRDRANGTLTAAVLPCDASPGTAQVPAGTYDIAFALTASDGTTLATAPAQRGV